VKGQFILASRSNTFIGPFDSLDIAAKYLVDKKCIGWSIFQLVAPKGRVYEFLQGLEESGIFQGANSLIPPIKEVRRAFDLTLAEAKEEVLDYLVKTHGKTREYWLARYAPGTYVNVDQKDQKFLL